ncbi:MAG: O-antigen ligase family protein [Candidatus Aegiribacteria sp.]
MGLVLIGVILLVAMAAEKFTLGVLLLGVPGILFLLAGSPVRVLMAIFALQIVLTLTQLSAISLGFLRVDDLLTILLVWLWVLSLPDRSMRGVRIGKQGIFIILFLVLFAVAALRGVSAGHNINYLISQTKTMGAYFLYFPLLWVLSDETHSRWLWKLLLWSAVAGGLIYTYKGFRGTGEDVYIRRTTGLRVTTRQPNAIGVVMLMYIGRLWKPGGKRPPLVAVIPSLILMSSALFLSQTRGIWGGVLLALALAWILNLFRRKDNIRLGRKLITSITVLAGLVAVLILSVSAMGLLSVSDIAERTGESGDYMTSTATLSRLVAWNAILQELGGTHILTGKGLGAVYTCFRPDLGAEVTVHYVDGSYFQIALNMGVIGVLAFLGIFVTTLVRAAKLFVRTDSRRRAGIALGIFCAVIMLLFASGFASVLTNYRYTILWVFLPALLQVEIIREKKERESDRSRQMAALTGNR